MEVFMHIMTRAVLFGLLLAGFATATPVFAGTLSLYNWGFNIDSPIPDIPPLVITFTTENSPTDFTPGTDFFALTNVAISSNPGTTTIGTIEFFLTGGLSIISPVLDLDDIDPDAYFTYTGTLGDSDFAPTFTLGAYTAADEDDPADTVTFTISPTPEPSSLALFGTGMLGLVGMIRRKLSV
jgi:hypothetical protein